MLRRAAIAALTASSLALPTTGAEAGSSIRADFVGFWGTYKGPGRTSMADECPEVYYGGTGSGIVQCTLTFLITRGVDVCNLALGDDAGTANYQSHIAPELDRSNVALTGADYASSGVVTGVVTDTSATEVFTIRISFASICDNNQQQHTRKFVGDGHLL